MDNNILEYFEKLNYARKKIFENSSTKEEAIEYLIKETNLSKDECIDAYNILMKINFSK